MFIFVLDENSFYGLSLSLEKGYQLVTRNVDIEMIVRGEIVFGD